MYIILSVGITVFHAQHGREFYYIYALSCPVTMNGMSLYYSLHILKVQAFIIGWECHIPNTYSILIALKLTKLNPVFCVINSVSVCYSYTKFIQNVLLNPWHAHEHQPSHLCYNSLLITFHVHIFGLGR
jgi:hypothetical protein